jgi:hypothetical protein
MRFLLLTSVGAFFLTFVSSSTVCTDPSPDGTCLDLSVTEYEDDDYYADEYDTSNADDEEVTIVASGETSLNGPYTVEQFTRGDHTFRILCFSDDEDTLESEALLDSEGGVDITYLCMDLHRVMVDFVPVEANSLIVAGVGGGMSNIVLGLLNVSILKTNWLHLEENVRF